MHHVFVAVGVIILPGYFPLQFGNKPERSLRLLCKSSLSGPQKAKRSCLERHKRRINAKFLTRASNSACRRRRRTNMPCLGMWSVHLRSKYGRHGWRMKRWVTITFFGHFSRTIRRRACFTRGHSVLVLAAECKRFGHGVIKGMTCTSAWYAPGLKLLSCWQSFELVFFMHQLGNTAHDRHKCVMWLLQDQRRARNTQLNRCNDFESSNRQEARALLTSVLEAEIRCFQSKMAKVTLQLLISELLIKRALTCINFTARHGGNIPFSAQSRLEEHNQISDLFCNKWIKIDCK